MPNYGVIDLGSNSIRLVVYDVRNDARRTYTRDDFRSLISDKVMAGLSAFVDEGVFTPAGVDRAVRVLKGHAKRARYFQCKRLDVFATAVLRNCTNSKQAIKEISERTEMPIALLSAEDEAHLGFVGASCDRDIERGTIVDIGGGSTELTRVRKGRDSDNESLGIGSLSSFAQHVRSLVPTATEIDAIGDAVWQRALGQIDPARYRAERFYGVGGSIRAAAKMYAQMHGLPDRPDELTLEQLASIVELALEHPDSYTHLALKASTERVHTLLPGVIILSRLMRELGGQTVEICKYGVREGYLITRMLTAKKARVIA